MEFLSHGGTEFACMSTTACRETALKFATSKCPLIFKFETKDFMSRGADISFLSVSLVSNRHQRQRRRQHQHQR